MFSNLTIGLVAGIGFGGWVYSKIYRSSGGNTRNALVVAGCSGLGLMVLVVVVLGIVFKK